MRGRSTRSIAPTRAACSPRSSACSAISTSPRRRCTTPSARRSSSGRARACRPIRAPGSSRPAASRRSTRMRRRARFDAIDDRRAGRATRRRDRRQRRRRRGRVEDDRLRLIFTCCHPALPPDAQVALTLREVCGLTTEEIAQRVSDRRAHARAAHRARQGEDPRRAHPVSGARRAPISPERLDSVLHVIYLVFNEGYSASSGRVADAGRSVGRGDPPRAAARRAAARARGDRAARADAAARIAARRAHARRRRPDPARRSGPLALEPRADRGGRGAGRARARLAPLRAVHAAGGDRGGARRGADRGRRPTGPRSSGSTTCCCAPIRRRSSS